MLSVQSLQQQAIYNLSKILPKNTSPQMVDLIIKVFQLGMAVGMEIERERTQKGDDGNGK